MIKAEEFGKSEHGNFIADMTTSTPHPFCITPKHIAYASKHHSGVLGEEAMRNSGIRCGHRGCNLLYDEHKPVLLIKCLKNFKDDNDVPNPELHAFLLSIKDKLKTNGVEGVGFIKGF